MFGGQEDGIVGCCHNGLIQPRLGEDHSEPQLRRADQGRRSSWVFPQVHHRKLASAVQFSGLGYPKTLCVLLVTWYPVVGM